jgi:hypothetical protein
MMNWGTLLVYLDVTVPLTVLLAIVAIRLIKPTRWSKTDLFLLLFLIDQVALNSLANILQDYRIRNHWVYLLNSLSTQLIFAFYFYLLFTEKNKKRLVGTALLLYVLFFIINLTFIQPYTTFNSYSYALGAFFIVLFGLISFLSWTEVIPGVNIINLKEFWVSAGILLYFGSGFFIFISYHYLSIVSYESVGVLWKLHNVFLAFGCLLFLKAMTCTRWILR